MISKGKDSIRVAFTATLMAHRDRHSGPFESGSGKLDLAISRYIKCPCLAEQMTKLLCDMRKLLAHCENKNKFPSSPITYTRTFLYPQHQHDDLPTSSMRHFDN